MHADLCRRASTIKQSPLWEQTFSNDDEGTAEQQFIDRLVQANTFDKLHEKDQRFFIDCERSEAIAIEMGFQVGTYLDEDELKAILDKLYANP
ncbi:MAG: hypothetical protein HC781_06450 [Leptolyngbyaceae cyanobacterium CSU_1_4]|nr:hypothetical protein [Leptolyngbyaceae cyanobacterium CSU_1_4]